MLWDIYQVSRRSSGWHAVANWQLGASSPSWVQVCWEGWQRRTLFSLRQVLPAKPFWERWQAGIWPLPGINGGLELCGPPGICLPLRFAWVKRLAGGGASLED